jgi:hypothetical protein
MKLPRLAEPENHGASQGLERHPPPHFSWEAAWTQFLSPASCGRNLRSGKKLSKFAIDAECDHDRRGSRIRPFGKTDPHTPVPVANADAEVGLQSR